MRRLARGDSVSLPPMVELHLVAARYGQPPASVRDWPADDYRMAVSCLPITNLVTLPQVSKDG